MSALSIQPTFPIFTETDGLPLENGYIWIGAANLDPQGNPINVYWDAALTIPAAQPIRTLNGYPSRSGTPARLYVNSDYSIRVQNSKGSLVYGAPQATERISQDVIDGINASTVPTTDQDQDAPWENVQEAIDYLIQVAPDAYDTNTSSSATLNDTFANTSEVPIVRPEAHPFRDNALGSSWSCQRLGTPVTIPARKHMSGWGDVSSFRPLLSLSADDMFRLNVDADGNTPTVNLPLGLSSSIERIVAVNRDENGDATTTSNVFKFAGQQEFYSIFSLGYKSAIRQSTGGNSYSDLTRAVRVLSLSQPDTNVSGTRSALVHLPTSGDGFVVSQVSNAVPVDPSGSGVKVRGYSVFVTSRNGGRISEIINGDIRVNASTAVEVCNTHMEFGFVQSLSSSGYYHDMRIYMRGDQTVPGTDDPVVGVPFQITKSGSDLVTNFFSRVERIAFIYAAGWTNPYSFAGNFSVEYTQNVQFAQMYRNWLIVTDGSISNIFGAIQSQTASQASAGDTSYLDFNNYSHFASNRAEWQVAPTTGSFLGGRWAFSADCGQLVVTVGLSAALSGTVTMPGSLDQSKWSESTGTYYYKAAIYYDKIRAIGVIGSAEISQAATNGSNVLPKLAIEPAARGIPVMVRLYRGTSTGSYSHYVDIPSISATALVDNGTDVCGFEWIARTPAAPVAVNAGISTAQEFHLRPGSYESGSDAYGIVEMVTDNVLPTTGGWRRGDKVLLKDAVGENAEVKIGWTRMTNCTSSAPAHALYVDWMPIMVSSPHGARTTTQLQDATNTVNTTWKNAGLRVFNSTTLKWCTAQGSAANSTWIEDGTGTVYTPV